MPLRSTCSGNGFTRNPDTESNWLYDISDLPNVPLEKGKHARRVIAAFEKLMREKGLEEEVRLLRFWVLFDRPVSREAVRLLHPFTDFSDSLITLGIQTGLSGKAGQDFEKGN